MSVTSPRIAHSTEHEIARRAAAAVLGAAAQDAASLGLHWVYNVGDISKKVAESASRVPEFQPQAAPWHAARTAGQGTMYGEQLLVTLRTLAAHPEHKFTKANFLTQFLAAFGPGGSYIGYADSATKGTVYNGLGLAGEVSAALAPPAGFTDGAVRMAVYRNLKTVAANATGEALLAAAEELVKTANPGASPAAIAYARDAASKLEVLNETATGATGDADANALAKLPALVARYAGYRDLQRVVVDATRMTANSDEAVTWCSFAATLLEAVVLGAAVPDAVRAAVKRLDQPYRAVVEHAIKLAGEEEDAVAAIGLLGQACDLSKTVPGAVYLALRAAAAPGSEGAFVSGVRANILAGGDSCGRGMLMGALLAAAAPAGTVTPVPTSWTDALACKDEVATLSTHLHVAPKDDEVAIDHVAVHHHGHGHHGSSSASSSTGGAAAASGGAASTA